VATPRVDLTLALRGGVGRNILGVLPVLTTPRAPVYPTGYTTCRPYRPPSRVCTDTGSIFGCIPLAGGPLINVSYSRRGRLGVGENSGTNLLHAANVIARQQVAKV